MWPYYSGFILDELAKFWVSPISHSHQTRIESRTMKAIDSPSAASSPRKPYKSFLFLLLHRKWMKWRMKHPSRNIIQLNSVPFSWQTLYHNTLLPPFLLISASNMLKTVSICFPSRHFATSGCNSSIGWSLKLPWWSLFYWFLVFTWFMVDVFVL